METRVIFDNILQPNQVYQSQTFRRGQYLYFDTPDLPSNEFMEFGASVVVKAPLIGTTKEKLVPVTFIDGQFTLQVDTNIILYLPREVGESDDEVFCYFHSSIAFKLRAYVRISSVTQEGIKQAIDDLAFKETVSDLAIISNQLAQNTALGILGVSLSPLTLGTSALVEAPLLTGASALTPLLLPAL